MTQALMNDVIKWALPQIPGDTFTLDDVLRLARDRFEKLLKWEMLPGIPGYQCVIPMLDENNPDDEPVLEFGWKYFLNSPEWLTEDDGSHGQGERDILCYGGERSVVKWFLAKTGHKLERGGGMYDPDFKHPNGVNHIEVKCRAYLGYTLINWSLDVGDYEHKRREWKDGDVCINICCDSTVYWCLTPHPDEWEVKENPHNNRHTASIPWRYWNVWSKESERELIELLTKGV